MLLQLLPQTNIPPPRTGRFDELKCSLGLSSEEMRSQLKLLRVHPAFRIVALAQPPSDKDRWLTSEVRS